MSYDEPNRSTGIEWTEHTWNPFVGCTIHTPGCTNCYAMRQAAKLEGFGGATAYAGTTRWVNGNPIWTGKLARASNASMKKPLTIREPSRIFVNSMSDFFHEKALAVGLWQHEAWEIMKRTPRHQYQILTKRPENIMPTLELLEVREVPHHIWLGVTVERGDFAHRIDTLRQVPAAVRFLSVEPLIGAAPKLDLRGIQWVIIGGESGPGARPMRPEWAREVRDACVAQNVPLFFKQWGLAKNNPIYHEPADDRCPYTGSRRVDVLDPVGKGGSILDGRSWKQYPVEKQASLL